MKKIGRDVEFLSDDIPESTLKFVHSQLPMCFNEPAVKAVFEQAKNEILGKPPEKEDGKMELAKSINKLAEGLFQ